MCTTTAEAVGKLGPVVDALLTHDRAIARPVDDSVMRLGAAGPLLVRRARGFVPEPMQLGEDGPTVLAVGGHLKATVALRLGREAILSQHVGDLDRPASRSAHRAAVADLLGFFRAEPEVFACDLHPDYASTRLAEELAAERGARLVRVQHHHAHVAACLAEHGVREEVLGLCWDGTGLGPDGTIWGGEALVADACRYRRVAHLRTFRLPGGEPAITEPRRVALSLLVDALGEDAAAHRARAWFEPRELETLLVMLRRGVRSPWTSSMGRLFDGVAGILGVCRRQSYEAEAAMRLETVAAAEAERRASRPSHPYPLPLTLEAGSPVSPTAEVDWRPLVRALLDDLEAGAGAGLCALRFHDALVEMAAAVAARAGKATVALSGGCFHNGLLSDALSARLAARGHRVLQHRAVPANDGGLALGQMLVACARTTG
jgi:hydrogenase maturation protein HypF